MRKSALAILLLLFMVTFSYGEDMAAQTFIFRGKIVDMAGKGVCGAEVFIYDSTNTRRPADFITGPSDKEGSYTIQLPAGKRYWAVARVRQDGKYGPLSPAAQHSGEPVAIDADEGLVERQFIVADIRQVAKGKQKAREDMVKVRGRVVDGEGAPVSSAYVLVNAMREVSQLPDYVSGWTEETGLYTLYLPPGEYFIGAAVTFPTGPGMKLEKRLSAVSSQSDIAIDVVLTAK
ncbi:hypothetical protein Geob_3356 [Geotalea daltonii FRC-32]|uniref:Carboxypeptidase regulatory-like domain-containing protein n=2 Tax=Geotalea TaxID=2910589 RepID=B9M515_GEODF|nr:hypothetical protein Geob_3356 [Geotalea daltonii FRC-32]